MKRKLIQIVSWFLRRIDRILIVARIKSPTIVVYIDGGICSQMLMYLQGQYYAEAGFDVRYDIRWFEICGKDQFGEHARVFELTEIWPSLPFRQMRGCRLWIYRHCFKIGQLINDKMPRPETITHSSYLYGYWNLATDDYKRLFAKYFALETATTPSMVSEKVDFKNVVGVHVRRGDLAKGDNPIYGGVSDGYFLRAIDFCNEKFKPKKYLFFSDEPDWVEQNICSHVEKPYEIMRGNKAWEDLWLLAHSPVIVSSQGSFGRVAAQLNPGATLIQCDSERVKRDRPNTYFIK